jgi:hypothetical protein
MEFSTILFVLVLLCETYGTDIGHLAAAAAAAVCSNYEHKAGQFKNTRKQLFVF